MTASIKQKSTCRPALHNGILYRNGEAKAGGSFLQNPAKAKSAFALHMKSSQPENGPVASYRAPEYVENSVDGEIARPRALSSQQQTQQHICNPTYCEADLCDGHSALHFAQHFVDIRRLNRSCYYFRFTCRCFRNRNAASAGYAIEDAPRFYAQILASEPGPLVLFHFGVAFFEGHEVDLHG